MELLLTILFWVVAIIVGFIVLPFVIVLVLFTFGLVAFVGLAAFFSCIFIVTACGSLIVDVLKPVTAWFRRTAGCK